MQPEVHVLEPPQEPFWSNAVPNDLMAEHVETAQTIMRDYSRGMITCQEYIFKMFCLFGDLRVEKKKFEFNETENRWFYREVGEYSTIRDLIEIFGAVGEVDNSHG